MPEFRQNAASELTTIPAMMGRPRLLVTRRLPAGAEKHLESVFETTFNESDAPLDQAALMAAMTNYDAICGTITDRFDASVLGVPSPRVRILASFGAGFEHVDLAAARDANIMVTNTPGALVEATAEIAILLMLMAARRAGEGERELRAGRWTGWRPTHMVGQGLSGKTLGLVGFGAIAQATATRAAAFGMRILHHSRRPKVVAGAHCVDTLAALAGEADVLSIHVPGGPETHHLIDGSVIGLMKPTAILINTARGSLVDEVALGAALQERQIAAAGLDVYESEPAVDPSLLACENVVLLPHLGSATSEVRRAMGMQVARNLEAFFAGEEPPDRVA